MTTARKIQEQLDIRFGKKRDEFKAILGRADGTVKSAEQGAGQNDVYVTLYNGDVITVHNDRVPRRPYLKILVGYDDITPSLLQVLRIDDVYNSRPVPSVPNHKETHTWFSHDPVDIYAEQFYPLLPRAAGGLILRQYGGGYFANGAHHILTTQDLDLEAEIPASGAEWVNVEVDEDGTITYNHGSNKAGVGLLTYEDIPATSITKKLLCSVRMYAGQTQIIQTRTNSDIFDPRFSGFGAGGAAGAVDWDDILNVPSVFTPDTDVTDALYPRKWYSFIDPTVTDDTSAGYAKLDLWLNQTSGQWFVLISDSVGAADWQPAGEGGGGNGDLIYQVEGSIEAIQSASQPILITKDTAISAVYVYLENTGASGQTIIDITINDIYETSIFDTIYDDRPTLPYNSVTGWVKVVPTVTDFVEGDILKIHIDEAAAGASNLVCILQVSSSGGSAFNLTLEDEGAAVSVSNVGKIVVPDGSLTDDGGGQVTIIQQPPAIETLESVPSGSLTTTSASYADVDGANMELSITKIFSGTDLIIDLRVSCFPTAATTDFQFGVSDGSTDYDVLFHRFDTTGRRNIAGIARITGLSPAVYTFRLRWKRVSGSGTLSMTTNDRVSMTIQEVQ
jgi:hypothetical protein